MIKKIFIFEFVSGGGFNNKNIPPSLFCEGFGMLTSIIADFSSLNFEIYTLLDYRISLLQDYLKYDYIEIVSGRENYLDKFKKVLNKCDSCFIIAPEFSNILYDLTKLVNDCKKTILSVGLDGILLGTSKIKTYEFFRKKGINTPATFRIPIINTILDQNFIIQKLKELKAIIIKPDDGVGAECIYYFDSERQIYEFFKNVREKIDINREYILQEFIEGVDLSLSLIGRKHPKNPVILSINFQKINIKEIDKRSEYFGGITPPPMEKNYEELIENMLPEIRKLNIPELNSYFGVDFIKKDDGSLYFIELNPRLTTSYIGIRNAIQQNPAKLIVNSRFNTLESIVLKSRNFSIFSRWELKYVGKKSIKEIHSTIIPLLKEKVPEFLTPPISFDFSQSTKDKIFSCFLATKTIDHNSSLKRLLTIKKILRKQDFIVS